MGESWVYSLECEDQVIYVGQTEQLFTRLNNHYLLKAENQKVEDCHHWKLAVKAAQLKKVYNKLVS